jgi:two-component system, chemotaxis family, chemotaxis protein CheY
MSVQTILIVDDSPSMRQLIAGELSRAGFQIVEAVDGGDAVDRLESMGEIHLALVDLNLPKLDGIGVIRALRLSERTRSIPLVVVSTAVRRERREEARKAGATGWIVKPFRPGIVLRVVRTLLGPSAGEGS